MQSSDLKYLVFERLDHYIFLEIAPEDYSMEIYIGAAVGGSCVILFIIIVIVLRRKILIKSKTRKEDDSVNGSIIGLKEATSKESELNPDIIPLSQGIITITRGLFNFQRKILFHYASRGFFIILFNYFLNFTKKVIILSLTLTSFFSDIAVTDGYQLRSRSIQGYSNTLTDPGGEIHKITDPAMYRANIPVPNVRRLKFIS